MTTIFVARHGQTDWNAEHRWQGHADPPLNERGRAEAQALAESLASRGIEAIYSSDLARGRETAEIVGARLGLPVVVDARLREVDVGEWSGLTTPEIEQLYPGAMERRREGMTGWTAGEEMEAMGRRVVEVLLAIAEGVALSPSTIASSASITRRPIASISSPAVQPVIPSRRRSIAPGYSRSISGVVSPDHSPTSTSRRRASSTTGSPSRAPTISAVPRARARSEL